MYTNPEALASKTVAGGKGSCLQATEVQSMPHDVHEALALDTSIRMRSILNEHDDGSSSSTTRVVKFTVRTSEDQGPLTSGLPQRTLGKKR